MGTNENSAFSGRKSGWKVLAFLLLSSAVIFIAFRFMGLFPGRSVLRPPPIPAIRDIRPETRITYKGSLRTLTGKDAPLADFEGKMLFMSFWATWCPPCRFEMPSIQRLYETYQKDVRMAFLMISTEPAEKVRSFIRKNGYTFPVYLTDSHLPKAYSIRGFPTTLLISPRGSILYRHSGAAQWDDPGFSEFLEEVSVMALGREG